MSGRELDPLLQRAQSDPDGPALRASAITWSNAQLLDAVDGLAASLVGGGVRHGSRVACLIADDAPAVTLVHALRRIGAVLVPLNRRATAPEHRYQIGAADVRHMVADHEHLAAATDAARGGLRLHQVEALLAGAACGVPPPLHDEIDLDAPATIVFTSGTTGRPKGALLTHRSHAASADAWAAILEPQPGDRWLACLPLFHVAGLAILTRAARWGSELEVHTGFTADAVVEAIVGGVTHLSLVAVQLEQVLQAIEGQAIPATLRAILLGGGPLPVGLLDRARSAGCPVLPTYGMTETASGIAAGVGTAVSGPSRADDVTALRPLPGVDVRIGAGGEIAVRGPMVFKGYVNAPRASAAALQDNWLLTGDMGSIDEYGLLRVSDRRDDVLVSGGENVYPAEVEAVLLQHPGVSAVAVAGRADPRWETVPVAYIVPVPDAELDVADLERYCRDRLAGYKVPVRFHPVATLPRDDLGKVRRNALGEPPAAADR